MRRIAYRQEIERRMAESSGETWGRKADSQRIGASRCSTRTISTSTGWGAKCSRHLADLNIDAAQLPRLV